MARYRMRAMSAESARRKATSKNVVCSKANYIPGSKKGRMKSYDVTTHKRMKD